MSIPSPGTKHSTTIQIGGRDWRAQLIAVVSGQHDPPVDLDPQTLSLLPARSTPQPGRATRQSLTKINQHPHVPHRACQPQS